MGDVVLWADVPEDQRRTGDSYHNWGPTEHRGCQAAVQWPKHDGYQRCAGKAMVATGFCRKHSERLGLVRPAISFLRRHAHRNGTGDLLIGGELEASTICAGCGRLIGRGEIIEPRRKGSWEAVCRDCAGIHESPYRMGFQGEQSRYLAHLRIPGCSACDQEATYRVGAPCEHCGGTGLIQAADDDEPVSPDPET